MNSKNSNTPKNVVAELRPIPEDADDGVKFINVYSRGRTYLGRELSHFNHKPFVHPKFGSFNTVEGFWHWYKSKEQPDELRYMNGPKARTLGQALTKEFKDDFVERILEANFCKIDQNPELKAEFLKSSLPFDHYYVFGKDHVLIRPAASQWLCDIFDRIRTMMWNGDSPKGFSEANSPIAEAA